MITELFLTCALAMPAVAHNYGPRPLINDEVSFSRKILHTDRNVLLVSGDPGHVRIFRHYGMKAFGALTEDRPGATPYHAVGDPHKIPYLNEVFQNVYWNHSRYDYSIDTFPWFSEAIRMVEPGGFLFIDETIYLEWGRWLAHRQWEPLPFKMGQFSIWKKPYYGDYFRRSA